MFDYGNLLHDPAYLFYGTEAVIVTVADPSVEYTLTVCNKTGSEYLITDFDRDKQHAGVRTTLPRAFVRKAEVSEQGLTRQALRHASLTMNGKTYRIEAAMPIETPAGEAEYELSLMERTSA